MTLLDLMLASKRQMTSEELYDSWNPKPKLSRWQKFKQWLGF